MQHDLRHAAGKKDLHRREVAWAIGQCIDDAWSLTIRALPLGTRRPAQTSGVRDGGDVQQKIRRSAEGRVHDHRVADGRVGDDVARADPQLYEPQQSTRRACSGLLPERLTGGCERGVRQREAERFSDDLRCRRRAEKLAAAARARTGTAADLCGVLLRDLTLREARADCLHATSVFTLIGQQRYSARHEHARQRTAGRERHHHRGQALIACGDPKHAASLRQ